MKKTILVSFFVLMFTISIVFVSANIFDWFGKITGEATSATTSASITISNTAPTIINVSVISAVDLTINSTKTTTFTFTVLDPDGVADITNSTAAGNFTKSGETSRLNNSCINQTPYNGTTTLFHCTITSQYYDGSGTWTVSANISDSGSSVGLNNSNTFTINALNAMEINLTSLTWGTVTVTSTNTGSNNDPIGVFNLGNQNLYTEVTGKDLLGYTTASKLIPTSYFTVDDVTAGCSGTALVNATSTNISAANPIAKGSYPAVGDRHFCLTQLYSNSSAQIYNTTGYGTWTITSVAG